MNELPSNPVASQQQKTLQQLYLLMEKQVKSYHKLHRMGNHSSIPRELAQDFLESMEYTANQVGGMSAHPDVETALRLGQKVLAQKCERAKSLLSLVENTVPRWQPACRWEALQCIREYLADYDHLHLAHYGPDSLFYPILISVPDAVRGMDLCLFYLHILWIENQIMTSVPEDVLEAFWDRLPAGTCNPCEHVLVNGLGKAILGVELASLTFSPEEHVSLAAGLLCAHGETLKNAAETLCRWLDLKDENAKQYVKAAIPLLSRWTGSAILNANLENLFL